MVVEGSSKALIMEKEKPHSVSAEQALLGCLLLQPVTVLANCLALGVDADSFYLPNHSTIWSTVSSLIDDGKAVDPVTVGFRLHELGILDNIGGHAYLNTLIDVPPSAANWRSYAQIVRETANLRVILLSCEEAKFNILEKKEGSEAVSEAIEKCMMDVASGGKASQARLMHDLVAGTLDRIETRAAGKCGVLIGFSELDRFTGNGLQAGEFWVLAARPGAGKTAMALNVACHAAKTIQEAGTKEHVVIFSLEMDAESLTERLVAMEGNVDTRLTYDINEVDMAKLDRGINSVKRLPILIDDTPAQSISAIRALSRRYKITHKAKLFIVDYLQLVRGPKDGTFSNRREEVDAISRGIKAVAKELKTPFLVLAQLNREIDKDKPRRPRLSDLRESGGIEADADTVMFLYNPEPDTAESKVRTIRLSIGKQRNGPAGVQIDFKFYGAESLFEQQNGNA